MVSPTDRSDSYHWILKFWAPLIRWRVSVKNSRVVATNGCFDILHAGHIHMLREARKLGDVLVVGLNSDASVRQLKGWKRPINNEENRKLVLEAVRYVDFVHIFYNQNAAHFLQVATPHVYVKSKDYSLKNLDVNEKAVLTNLGTQIEFVDMVPQLSTTGILKRI